MQRFRLSWLLILALIAASLAPAQAGWFCANGLPCAVAMAPANRAPSPGHACCRSLTKPACHVPSGDTGRAIEAPRTCQYRSGSHLDRALHSERNLLRLAALDAAFMAAPALSLPVAVRTPSWAPDPDGYHPPPGCPSGPSRAPPSA